MGLDSYLYRAGAHVAVDPELAYWRKCYDVTNWFSDHGQNLRDKLGMTDPYSEDGWQDYTRVVTGAQLIELLEHARKRPWGREVGAVVEADITERQMLDVIGAPGFSPEQEFWFWSNP